jgi:drug/metabolite transporter (DMT)-like permease
VPSRKVAVFAVALLCVVWGSTWLVIKEGLRDLPVLTSVAVRFSLAAGVFVLMAPALHRIEGGARPPWRLVATMGTLNFAVSYGAVYWAETVLPSGLTSVLWSTFPLLTAVLGHVFLPDERLAPRQWAGFSLGFLGVAALFVADLPEVSDDAVWFGAILLVSPVAASVGQTIVKRSGGHVSAALLSRNAMVLAAILLWPVALFTELGQPIRFTGRALFSLGYLSLVGTCLTFGLYYWLLRFLPAHRMSLISYVTPAIALLLGSLLGHEAITGALVLGSAMILGGVALVVRAPG